MVAAVVVLTLMVPVSARGQSLHDPGVPDRVAVPEPAVANLQTTDSTFPARVDSQCDVCLSKGKKYELPNVVSASSSHSYRIWEYQNGYLL